MPVNSPHVYAIRHIVYTFYNDITGATIFFNRYHHVMTYPVVGRGVPTMGRRDRGDIRLSDIDCGKHV